MVRWTAPSPVTGADGADLAAGGIPVMCRSGIAGRRATISGGAVRRGRTAAGRVRSGAAGAGAALSARRDADADAGAGAGPGPSADAAGFVGGVPDVAPGARHVPVGLDAIRHIADDLAVQLRQHALLCG
ncbi:hypothetical protein ACFY2F_31120, partial [Streptomyces sp. NPDC001282]